MYDLLIAILKVVKGSSNLFKALLDRCRAREVVAICRYIARQNAQPLFVALVPQAEKLDENNLQVEAPGFHVVFLPFAEDFRTLHFEESTKGGFNGACSALVTVCIALVSKLLTMFPIATSNLCSALMYMLLLYVAYSIY